MSEVYAFLFCFALGIAARFFYMATTKLAERTDILPVTVILDILTVCAIGGAFTAYVILTDTVLAPYMFTALFGAYLVTYLLTRKTPENGTEKSADGSEKSRRRRGKNGRKSEAKGRADR